ncbi:hypothetical protein [Novosphingobium soli]|uniref:Uncharacterized protein n=1 Tax=Novosphingobium soli TaxID=574956 RepID=A0ABV6CXN6_9SPHN
MSGFALLFREAADHPLLAGDSARLGAWAWLVLKGCWKPTRFRVGGKVVELDRGQLCVSRSQLADAWGWSPSSVERFLTRLETEQMIGRETGQGRTIITICNYAKYQDVEAKAGQAAEQPDGQAPDSDRTTKEQINHITKDIPSPNGDGRGEPAPLADDMAASIFRTGLLILCEAGHEEAAARRVIGKWRKNYSTGSVLGVLASCRRQAAPPSDPIEWIVRALENEKQRAAGQVSLNQGPAPERKSVRELGMEMAARKRSERLAREEEQKRIAFSAG